jgi:16S rRNA (guanine527-N7)-methyltransferase
LWLERFLEVGERVLDVGSGGGVPGVVLAIVRPDLQVELTESVGKKAKALSAIVAELGLSIPVHHAAAQDVVADRWHDTLTIRAVAPLRKLLSWFAPHWNNIGRILLIKGPAWIEERGDARHRGLLRGLQLRRLAGYPLIDSQNESVVLQISPEER